MTDPNLTAFWITFAGEPELHHSYGVTAYSLEDALALVRKRHMPGQTLGQPVRVLEGVRPEELDQGHVLPNAGPMVLRGVWYPCLNLGDEAP